jgi:hypothetical protein
VPIDLSHFANEVEVDIRSLEVQPTNERANSIELGSKIHEVPEADSKNSEITNVNPELLPSLDSDGPDAIRLASQMLTENSHPIAGDRGSNESLKSPCDFIMPIIAKPNVRDPTSLSHTPVPSTSSQPDTPQSNVSSLPLVAAAIANFMRDNNLSTDNVHDSSGLFTPLEEEDGPIVPSSASDRTEVEIQDNNVRLNSMSNMTPSPTGRKHSIDGARATSTPTGSEVLDSATSHNDLGRECVKDIIELAKDSASLTSDHDRPSLRTPKPDSPSQNPQPTETDAAVADDDTWDLELAYPSMPITFDDHEARDVQADHSHAQPALEVGATDEVHSAKCRPQPSVTGSPTETDQITEDVAVQDIHIHKSHVGNEQEKDDSAFSLKAKAMASDLDDPFNLVGSATIVSVHTDEDSTQVSPAILDEETTGSTKYFILGCKAPSSALNIYPVF